MTSVSKKSSPGTKLKTINDLLKSKEDALSQLEMQSWCLIFAQVAGVCLAIADALMASPLVFAVGGVIYCIAHVMEEANKMERIKLQASIDETRVTITKMTDSYNQLKYINDNYKDLSVTHGNLNSFWGRLALDAGSILDQDLNIQQQIGTELLTTDNYLNAV
ncbi:hypothetical protein BGZ80_008777 [Entomortierella chlamydospora]|uniref:Uncharacterized protein n=1 Tax=Entomortierella chlamydospora TaxID=101097 RepID=A0A9P6MX26_9FUNG|nr:hypothetical protein BGZ80_008777 [Entomortierella chlamydospora]